MNSQANAKMWLSISFLFTLLLSSASALIVPTLPRGQVGRFIHEPVQLQAKQSLAQAGESDRCTVSNRQRGERRKNLLVRMKRVLPKKKKVAAFVIAVMAYLRGPSLLGSNVDPNVAHAGINVKVSGVKVEATIKDIPPLIPIRALAPKRTKSVSKGVETVATKELQNLITSRPGTLVISAGGGILAGTYARRKVKSDDETSKEQARKERDDKIVQDMLKEPMVEEGSDEDSEKESGAEAFIEIGALPIKVSSSSEKETDETETTSVEEKATASEQIVEPVGLSQKVEASSSAAVALDEVENELQRKQNEELTLRALLKARLRETAKSVSDTVSKEEEEEEGSSAAAVFDEIAADLQRKQRAELTLRALLKRRLNKATI